jgi:lysophospholipase L1-like esterase
VPDGSTFNSSSNGAIIGAQSQIGVSNSLRAHFSWVSLDYGSGSFRPGVRLGASPFTTVATGTLTSTNTGEFSVKRSTVDIPAATRTTSLEAKFYIPGSSVIVGPFAGLYARFENPNLLTGICLSTLYAAGGQSLWDMAQTLIYRSLERLTDFFSEVRRLQIEKDQKPIVVIYINSGLNDQNETSTPSWGYRAGIVGDSANNYIDNLDAIAERIEDVWQKNKWDLTELYYLILPSHPISAPDATKLIAYRKAASSWAGAKQRASFVDFTNLTSYTEMLSLGYYLSGGTDVNHLSSAGYNDLAARVVSLIPEVQ